MNTVLLLGAGIALTGAAVRALKTDTFSILLARFSLPPVPKAAMPWLSVMFGLTYAVLAEMSRIGVEHWQDALVVGVLEGLGVGVAATGTHEIGKTVPGVKRMLAFVLVFTIPMSAAGCGLLTKQNAKTALDAVQLACVFESQVTDEKVLADACGVARDLMPLLRELVAQREGAKRSGVGWRRPTDAGADSGADAGQ